MTKDKLFHKSYAEELFLIAEGDLESAEVIATNLNKGRKENICFAALQSIEKSLKSLLCALGQPIPLTHTIELILDRLKSSANLTPPLSAELVELTDFATIRRYQEGSEILTTEDVAATIAAARQTLNWVQENIKKTKAPK